MKLSIVDLFKEVRNDFYRKLGYDVSWVKLIIDQRPTYTDGRLVPPKIMKPYQSGGNTIGRDTIRINPRYREVMKYYGVTGNDRLFVKTIIAHEIGHLVDLNYLINTPARKRLLEKIKKLNFTTVYLDSYDKEKTDDKKLQKELIAEYLAYLVV